MTSDTSALPALGSAADNGSRTWIWPAAAIACLSSVVGYSIIYQHWLEMFALLFKQEPTFDIHPFDTRGFGGMFLVTVGLLFVSGVLLAMLSDRPMPTVERLVWTCLLAIGIAGVPTIALSVFGLLYPQALVGTLGTLGVVIVTSALVSKGGWRRVSRWWMSRADKTPDSWQLPGGWTYWILGYIVVMGATLIFHSATTPVYDYDAAIYHDAMAKILVNQHGMPLIAGPSPGIEMSANYPPLFPALGAVTLLSAGGNDLFLRLLAVVAAGLATAAAYCVGRRQAGSSLGLLAAGFTLTAQVFASYSTFGTVYTLMAFVTTMGFLGLVMYCHEGRGEALFLAGACLGLLFLCSYQAGIYLTWLPVVAWLSWRHQSPRTALANTVRFGAPLIVIGAFWYIRNWIVLGDPIYPWLYRVFGGLSLNSPVTALAQASVTQVAHDVTFGFGQTPTLTNLLHVTLMDRSLFPVLSPITIVGFVAAFALTRRSSVERSTVWMVIPCAVIPILVFEASGTFFLRYFIPALPILALLPAYAFYGFAGAYRRGLIGRRAIAATFDRITLAAATVALVGILLFPGLLVALSGQFYSEAFDFQVGRPYLAGWHSINPDPYTFNTRADDAGFAAFAWIQSNTPPGRRVATYESRLYYLFDADWQRILFLDGPEVNPIWNQSDPDAVRQYLTSRDVTYVWLSRIVQVGADKLPLATSMVGNTPDFPIVRQWSDAFVYQVGPLALGIGESPDITMNNQGLWSTKSLVDNTPTRAVMPTSPGNEEPAGLLVQNHNQPGFVVFDYLDNSSASELAVDSWTGLKPSSWQRLLTQPLTGSGGWKPAAVRISGSNAYGTSRLALRPSGGPVSVRNIRFVPSGTNSADMTLIGGWQARLSSGGQIEFVGVRTDPASEHSPYADINVVIPRNVLPYLDLQYRDEPGQVSVFQKVGDNQIVLATVLSAGTGLSVTQRIPISPSSLALGHAYLIFDTHGRPFVLQGLYYTLPRPDKETDWEPTPQVLIGNWTTTVIQGQVVGIAHRDNTHSTDIDIPGTFAMNTPMRLVYFDVGHAVLIVSAIDSAGKWHEIGAIRTRASNQVLYFDLTSAQRYPRPNGVYLVLDTKGTTVPTSGVQVAVSS